jgi:SulP family sulfate permease
VLFRSTLALLLLLLAPAAKLIPLAALAGILIIVSYNMSELHHFLSILKGAKSDALVLVLTCGLTILVDLTVGVEVGVVLAALLFVKHMSEVSNVGVIAKEDKEEIADDPEASALQRIPAGVEVFEVTGPLFFGMIDVFKNAMRNIEKPVPILIIQTRDVSVIDSTGIHVLRELFHKSQKQGTKIVFAGVNDELTIAFEKSGLLEEIGKQNFCENIDCAIKRCEEIMGKVTKQNIPA